MLPPPISLMAVLTVLLMSGCGNSDSDQGANADAEDSIALLYDFDRPTLPADIQFIQAEGHLTPEDATSAKRALTVSMASSGHRYTAVTFRPASPWDWSAHEDFSLALDIANRGEVSAQLFLDVEDIDGAVTTRRPGRVSPFSLYRCGAKRT